MLKTKGEKPVIQAVVLDKDDCFAYPEDNVVFEAYKVSCVQTCVSELPKLNMFRNASRRCELRIRDGDWSSSRIPQVP